MPLKAVLLDVDGTLVDSNDAHAMAWKQTLNEFGYPVPLHRIRTRIGEGGDKLIAGTIGVRKTSREGRAIARRYLSLFKRSFLPRLHSLPGARALVEALRARGLRMVVASSADRGGIDDLLSVAGVRDLVDDVVTGDDASASKPDPDVVVAAVRAAGCLPSEAILLGDTPYDLEAASGAHVPAIALRCGGWDDRALARAVALYDNPAHLLAELSTSPIAGVA